MRRIKWVRGALRDFATFPSPVQDRVMFALRMAAQGKKADAAKPMKGLAPGCSRSPCVTAVYAVQLDDDDVWVLHAFQKKSKTGLKTPKHEIDLIRERIKRIMEQLP